MIFVSPSPQKHNDRGILKTLNPTEEGTAQSKFRQWFNKKASNDNYSIDPLTSATRVMFTNKLKEYSYHQIHIIHFHCHMDPIDGIMLASLTINGNGEYLPIAS